MRRGVPRGGKTKKGGRSSRGAPPAATTAAWVGEIRGLIGERWARRIGRTMIALAVGPFVIGVAVFLAESQTIGQMLMATGAGFGLLFVLLRRDPEAVLGWLRAKRWVLVAVGSATVIAGWVVYFSLSEIVGLLLVVLGALPLCLTLFGVRQDPLASPLDGPPFGETGA